MEKDTTITERIKARREMLGLGRKEPYIVEIFNSPLGRTSDRQFDLFPFEGDELLRKESYDYEVEFTARIRLPKRMEDNHILEIIEIKKIEAPQGLTFEIEPDEEEHNTTQI